MKKKGQLSDTQYQIFSYIRHFMQANGYAPTKAEIAKGLSYKSANSVQEALPRIAKKGYIKLVSNIARGIVLL